MNIHVEHDSPVPPAKVQDYFFDLREDDHKRGNHPTIIGWKEGDYRKILSRSATEVHAQDAYQGGRVKVDFVLTKNTAPGIDYDVKGAWYNSRGQLTTTPKGTGSHVTFHSDAKWHGMGLIMKIFMKNMLEKAITNDMKEHMRLMDEDWAKAPW